MTLLFLTLTFAQAGGNAQYYIEKASKLKLAESRYWHLLLHMRDGESEIDDSRFFFAKNGNVDAQAELNATIEAFFNESRFDDNSSACRFPERKAWLTQRLSIKDYELPKVECKEFEETLKKLSPKSATLIFPAAHINSPASMFGHTFLRINSTYNSKLLAYAVNYAANADPNRENAIGFAIKGLFGGYYGRYSLLPYYEKLKEYRDTEKRDIWEYDLNLNEDEVLRMVRHIWELNGIESKYYFFTENCSYNILWLIEVARPEAHLREHFTYQVIPLETIHAAFAENLVESETYRPSKHTKLLKYEDLIDEKYIKMVKELAEGKLAAKKISLNSQIDIDQRRYILEAAIEYLEYIYPKSEMQKDEFLAKFYSLSRNRALLKKGKKIEIKNPQNPIKGHRAVKVEVGVIRRSGQTSALFGIRPAYHTLEDPSFGYLRGTQIEFLNILLAAKDGRVKAEDITILSIVSLSQRSKLLSPLSWRTKFGWDRDSLKSESRFVAT
ncbi:MAG: DUF4105 domain-containing protein, partial [Hydrogenimonas sp.]|nr:DUF4105 domain-containing protein [Hydrogenimonas sp.]